MAMRVPPSRWKLLVAVLTAGCARSDAPSGTSRGPEPSGAPMEAAVPRGRGSERVILSFVDELARCDVSHRGLLADFGPEALVGRLGWEIAPPKGIVASEPGGATTARIYDAKIALRFVQHEVAPVFVALRAKGGDAGSVDVVLDEVPLGQLRLAREEPRVVSTRATRLPIDAGLHLLELRFRGGKRGSAQPHAEIDWVRVAAPDEIASTYGPPTLFDVRAPGAELGGVPHQALALRAPGAVGCSVRVPPGGRLRLVAGMRGDGAATAAVVVREDGKDASVLERLDVQGGPDARWREIDVALDAFARRVVHVELAVLKTTGTGRLLLGDPVVVAPVRAATRTPAARAAVLVILDGVERSELPPWRDLDSPHLPTLGRLARTATVFDQHRAPATLVSASVASLLTGLPPLAHALNDGGARLPAAVGTLGTLAREASVRAAMWTGVPASFGPVGFAVGWDRFTQHPPNGDRLASAPFEDATAFLADAPSEGAARPRLAVLHARGGHPPWELTPAEAAKLPPPDYAGPVEPRAAAQVVARARARQLRLNDADRVRLRALFLAGLAREDAALGKLVALLEESGRWESTLLVVTAAAPNGRRSMFADGSELGDERVLELPLYVHFPGGLHGGVRSDRPTEVYDVTLTVMRALGLEPPADALGRDLASVVASDEETDRIRVAVSDDRYAARWGSHVLVGRAGERPRLCVLPVDPTCAFDRAEVSPIVTDALVRRLATFVVRRAASPPPREPVDIDPEFAAVLNVWGAY
jgi:arylsulfatase A-like enzyme